MLQKVVTGTILGTICAISGYLIADQIPKVRAPVVGQLCRRRCGSGGGVADPGAGAGHQADTLEDHPRQHPGSVRRPGHRQAGQLSLRQIPGTPRPANSLIHYFFPPFSVISAWFWGARKCPRSALPPSWSPAARPRASGEDPGHQRHHRRPHRRYCRNGLSGRHPRGPQIRSGRAAVHGRFLRRSAAHPGPPGPGHPRNASSSTIPCRVEFIEDDIPGAAGWTPNWWPWP